MPTPKNRYDREHLRNLALYQRQVEQIFMTAAQEAAAIGVSIHNVDTNKPFTFDDYPATKKRVGELIASLRKSVEVSIVNGVRSEWTLANNKNNELCNRVFGKNVGKLSEAQYRRYYSTNEKAREAFLERKENGLKLSDRVWRYSNEFKSEIEMGLDLGIRSGLDAPTMARDLKQYLRHPDKLFRRVRDEHGNLQLSKAATAFHPGRGVYRSSYMNARRLAATECNIAYRTADHERMKKMDFIVGIEIHLSNNHTCKGRDGKPHPFHDICDELQGKYPKDFKFTGWHPHCRCFVTSVMKTDAEIAEDTKRILRGEKVTEASENTVEDVPEGFNKWVKDNGERIDRARQLPYFLRDNVQYVEAAQGTTKSGQIVKTNATVEQIASEWMLGARNVPTDIPNSILKDFDFMGVKSELSAIAQRHGIRLTSWECGMKKDYYGHVEVEGDGFDISRQFIRQGDGTLEVHHALFKIREEYQGNGMSREIFRVFYEQYKRMGVDVITVEANIDVGGYCWARYGFQAESKHEALRAVSENPKLRDVGRAFVEKHYKQYDLSADAPFPMKLITEQPWGKEALLGTYWSGRLDLRDESQRKAFEVYLSRR